MKLHDVRQKSGARQPRKRVGRGHGSGTGKTSGRGHKGAKSRSGYKHKAAFEGGQMPLVRRIPKRGFSNYHFRKDWAEVNVGDLARFAAGSTVDPQVLGEARMVKGRFHGIVILGNGDLEVALTVRAHRFSKGAVTKIEAAGGKAEVVELPSSGADDTAATEAAGGATASATPVVAEAEPVPAAEEEAGPATAAENAAPADAPAAVANDDGADSAPAADDNDEAEVIE